MRFIQAVLHAMNSSYSARECLLTVHVHEDADVGVSHRVEHLTRHGLGEERVIRRGDKHALSGPLQQHAAFSPPDGTTHGNAL